MKKLRIIFQKLPDIFTLLVQAACIYIMFVSVADTVTMLNKGGFHTLFSLLFLAPIFMMPLFICLITSIVLLIISAIKRQRVFLALQLIVLGFSLYFAISFFTQVQLG